MATYTTIGEFLSAVQAIRTGGTIDTTSKYNAIPSGTPKYNQGPGRPALTDRMLVSQQFGPNHMFSAAKKIAPWSAILDVAARNIFICVPPQTGPTAANTTSASRFFLIGKFSADDPDSDDAASPDAPSVDDSPKAEQDFDSVPLD